MSREEERILIDRLGRLAWRWGRHIGNGSGGRQGAHLAARLLPENVHEIELVLASPPDGAAALWASGQRSTGQR